jgi:hypothetical protein
MACVDKDLDLPSAYDPSRVGTYPAVAKAGGGYVWDTVLEYRVWCHPVRRSPDDTAGDDYYRAFASYGDALAFAKATSEAEEPVALVIQEEYIDEPTPGEYVHVVERRVDRQPGAETNGPGESQARRPHGFLAALAIRPWPVQLAAKARLSIGSDPA